MSDPLGTYLHDHLSGARSAIELIHAMRERHKDQPLDRFLAPLLTLIEKDRDTLQGIVDKVGSGGSVAKEVVGWVGEKATRLKLGQSAAGDLGTFEALEFLALGILGKVGLWQALDVAAASDARLRGYDFKQLADSAESQHAKVEQQRLDWARTALRPMKDRAA